VGEHNDVGVNSYNRASPANVGFDDIFTEGTIRDFRIIVGYENGRFEFIGRGIVEILHMCKSLLLNHLRI